MAYNEKPIGSQNVPLQQKVTSNDLIVTLDGESVTVTGAVTANAGTNLNTSALALDATLTNKTQFTKLTDGTDTGLITAAGEQNVLATAQPGVDIGDVTINNAAGGAAVNIQDGGNSITVDNNGTFAVQSTPVADIAPATQNITTQDLASTSAAGANNQTIIIGTPTAGSAASFTLVGIETVRVEVTGIWTGTIASEASIDGGTTWTTQGLHQGAYTTGSFTAGFIGGANVAGATNYRIRATGAITGTVVVRVVETVNTQSVYIANAAPSGTVTSVLNSSTTTLGGGATFTGTGEDVTNFSEMRISVFSNVASATDGLSMQQSTDNTNWDITDTYSIPAATGKTFVIPRQARYFRVVYTNGAGAQASFRLQSILNRTATAPSSQRATDGYTNETDLVQNQVFPMEFNGTTWDRQRGDTTNGLDVDVTRVIPGTTATALGKTEDVPHVTGDTGVFMLAVANEANTTLAGDGDYIAHATDTEGSNRITGNRANDAVDSGNPIKIGGKASTTLPTAVSANDRVDGLFDSQGRFITAQKAETGTTSSVAGSATSVSLLAAQKARLGAIISNDSTAILYVKLGTTASTTSYAYKLYTDDTVEIPYGYSGAIDAIWASATGNARITEIT